MIARPRPTARRWAQLLAAAAVCTGLGLGLWALTRPAPAAAWRLAQVVRDRVAVTLTLTGEVAGERELRIDCEVQTLPSYPGGPPVFPTITWFAENGSIVHKDDVICRFETSHFEELARRQSMELDRARSGVIQAQLTSEAAAVGLRAYRDGTAMEREDSLRGQLAMARSDLQLARERLDWSENMYRLGYLATERYTASQAAVQRYEVQVQNGATALENHQKYTVPKVVRQLEVALDNALAELEFARDRLRLGEKRLADIEEQIERCEVRSPHDGMVIHFSSIWDNEMVRLEVGKVYYTGLPIFYLPDLVHPVIKVALPQSNADSIEVGMPAQIRIEAMPALVLTGRVSHIDQLPTDNERSWAAGSDIKDVSAQVAIDDPPDGLLPGMTALARVTLRDLPAALLVPVNAISIEGGLPFCYVPAGSGFERRRVAILPADRNRVEIRAGLDENEWVVLDASRVPDRTQPITPFPEPEPEATISGESNPPSFIGSTADPQPGVIPG